MSFYAENNNVGITYGLISLTATDWESDYISLDIEKHPKKAKPTVVLTPQGTLANVNVHAQVQFASGVWQFKAYISDGVAEAAGAIKVNYNVISTWAN